MVAVPWVIWCLILLGYNLYMNIEYNDWWKYGNPYLLINTFYIVVQILLSVPLVGEFKEYMDDFDQNIIVRSISLSFAILYNNLWLSILAFWLFH